MFWRLLHRKNIIESCICGHSKKDHEFFSDIGQHDCLRCMTDPKFINNKVQYCHDFKLDNLKLVENLAEKRGLR
jgi:hypothetical protein